MRWNPIVALFVLLLLGTTAGEALGDFLAEDWMHMKRIDPGGGWKDGYAYVVVDGEVYHGSRPDLADLRVVDSDHREVPYKIEVQREEVVEKGYHPAILNRVSVPGEKSSFVVDLGRSGRLHNCLRITSPTRNFRKTVTVEACDDLKSWRLLKKKAHIFDFSADFRARFVAVRYPKSTFRYLRVILDDAGEKPIEIGGARVWIVTRTPGRLEARKVEVAGRIEDGKDRCTRWVLDMGYGKIPASRLEIDSPDRNYFREVVVEGSDDCTAWREIGRGHIHHIDTARFQDRAQTVSFPESRYRYIRVSVLHSDNPAIAVSGIRIFGLERRLIFPSRTGKDYLLYYGNPAARSARYDIDRILPYVDPGKIHLHGLQPEKANPDYREKIPERPWTEDKPWLLYGILGAAILFLAIMIFRLMRRMEPDRSDPSIP
jgi:hypothetical protein